MSGHPNQLLARFDSEILERILSQAMTEELPQAKVLAETHEPIHRVYFPHSGIISNVVELIGGGAIETGMVGRDGVFGAAQALDGMVSLNHVVVQSPGIATVLEARAVLPLAIEFPELRKALLAYERFSYAQAQQTAACNATHSVSERLCKWLMRTTDLVEGEMPLTQEILAQMMGVRRTSVTAIAVDLATAGLITYRRGRVRVLDVKGLKAHCCECHDELRLNYQRLFPAK